MDFLSFLHKNQPKTYENINITPPATQSHTQTTGIVNNPHALANIQPQQAQPIQGNMLPDASIMERIDPILSTIEQVTGLTRREIFLQVLKSGVRGGGIGGLLEGLLGQKPAPEAKLIRYVKIFALWFPAFVLLMGFVLISLIVFAKFTFAFVGGG